MRPLSILRAAFSVALSAATGVAWPDDLATLSEPGVSITLKTDRCGPTDNQLQQAVKRVEALRFDGCWSMSPRGNPIVLWSDGTVQHLDESRLVLTPRYAAMLRELDGPHSRADAGTAAGDFRKAYWCKDASFPHERLICSDEQLAAADLALSPLWRSYRQLMRQDEARVNRVKRDYFRRLKACGADRACIAREQAAQERFYREALASR